MTLVEQYTQVSEEIIENNTDITEYEKKLLDKQMYINSILISNNIAEKLIHPIRLIVTISEKNRINRIKSRYYKIRNSNLLENMEEETGEFGDDLYNAARYTKPRRLEEYISTYSIDNAKIDKKLLKERK